MKDVPLVSGRRRAARSRPPPAARSSWLPDGPGGMRFKYCLAQRVWGIGIFFKYWFAQRVWRVRIFLSTGLPNGSGGVSDFFEYWFPQRVWRGFGFFLSTGLPNGSGGVLDLF